MTAASTYNISPFHLVSRILLEQGNDGTGVMNGYTYTTSSGGTAKVYNLFNIQVSGNTTSGYAQGAKYAYSQGWFTPEASIIGGARFLREKYIDQGQSTLYFQKYNVVDTSSLFSHQYMQNIRAANDEGYSIYKNYKKNGLLDSHFEFLIPVYENMPTTASARPVLVELQDITFSQDVYVINKNEAVDLDYIVSPSNASNLQLKWTSSNDEILRVWYNRFRGLKEGTAEVIVKTKYGNFEKRITVIIKDPDKSYVQDIKLEKEEYTVGVNEAVDLPYTVSPVNSTNAEFEWTSSNPEILRVWGNRFRALKPGTAYVIVRTTDGTFEKRIKVTIKNIPVEDVKLEQEEYTVEVNEAVDLPYTVYPTNSTNAEFIWTSSNDEILRVWYNRFRALKEGTAYVIVRTTDGTFEKKIKVTIKDSSKLMVNDVKLEQEEYTVGVNEAVDLPYTVSPVNSINAEFIWTSSNDEILRVWYNRFRALKPGTAYVIVRTTDGTFEKRIKVTIKNIPVEDVKLEQEEYTVGVNEAVDLPYTVYPTNSTNAEFIWTSSNDEILRVWYNRFRALKPGTAYVIVRTTDGTFEKRIKVNITDN